MGAGVNGLDESDEVAPVQNYQKNLLFDLRRGAFQDRIKQVIEQNKTSSFISIIIFTIYSIMLIRYQKDVRRLSLKYPDTALFLVASTALMGLEFLFQTLIQFFLTLELGNKCCLPLWIYILCSISFNIWGVSFVFQHNVEEFRQLPSNEYIIIQMA